MTGMNAQRSMAMISERDFAAPVGDEPDLHIAELENEVARLRARLARASAANRDDVPPASAPRSKGNAAVIRNVIDARSRRGAFLPPSLFADPAWDMLLDLFMAHLSQVRISISSLCVASNVPTTTALRWLKVMQDRGLVERRSDPLDARRHFIDLTPTGVEAMTGYFSSLGNSPTVI
jgi:hypothetical protein